MEGQREDEEGNKYRVRGKSKGYMLTGYNRKSEIGIMERKGLKRGTIREK